MTILDGLLVLFVASVVLVLLVAAVVGWAGLDDDTAALDDRGGW